MEDGGLKFYLKMNNRISKQDFIKDLVRETKGALLYKNEILVDKNEKGILKKGVKLLCNKYKPKSVLEVGFGLGYTAQEFQDYEIERHTIIEPHPTIYARAVEWANQFPNRYIKVIERFFQDYETDEKFDIVYDDRKDMVYYNDEFIRSDEPFRRWIKTYVKRGGIVAGYARELEEIKEFDNGFFFEIDGKKYRQPLIFKDN